MADEQAVELPEEILEAPERGSAEELLDAGAHDPIDAMRHSTAHVMAEAVLGLFPGARLGIGPAIEWQAREFSRRSGVPATVEFHGEINGSLSEAERTSLFRIVQEALTNITKHAKASEVHIDLSTDGDGITLTVGDNGRGMLEDRARGSGLGLLGMEERALELGGRFTMTSTPGEGTRIEVWLPRRMAA